MCISRLPPNSLLAWFCIEDFQTCLNLLKQRGLVICSRLNSLEGEEDFLRCLNLPRGYISSSPGCIEDLQSRLDLLTQRGLVICSRLNTLEGEEDFLWCLNLPRGYISSSPGCTEDLQSVLAWTHSRVRRTFSGASTCPGVTSPLPPDALRTCNLFLPELTRGWGGLSLSSRLHSLTARRTF